MFSSTRHLPPHLLTHQFDRSSRITLVRAPAVHEIHERRSIRSLHAGQEVFSTIVVILKVVALLQQAWPEFDCATRGETRLATERCWGLDEQAQPLGLDSGPRA